MANSGGNKGGGRVFLIILLILLPWIIKYSLISISQIVVEFKDSHSAFLSAVFAGVIAPIDTAIEWFEGAKYNIFTASYSLAIFLILNFFEGVKRLWSRKMFFVYQNIGQVEFQQTWNELDREGRADKYEFASGAVLAAAAFCGFKTSSFVIVGVMSALYGAVFYLVGMNFIFSWLYFNRQMHIIYSPFTFRVKRKKIKTEVALEATMKNTEENNVKDENNEEISKEELLKKMMKNYETDDKGDAVSDKAIILNENKKKSNAIADSPGETKNNNDEKTKQPGTKRKYDIVFDKEKNIKDEVVIKQKKSKGLQVRIIPILFLIPAAAGFVLSIVKPEWKVWGLFFFAPVWFGAVLFVVFIAFSALSTYWRNQTLDLTIPQENIRMNKIDDIG